MFMGHGIYAVEHDREIIVFVAQGAWNVEASQSATKLISKYVNSISNQEFAIIADTSQVEGITPDSAEVWSEAVNEWHQKGHTTLARVDNPESAHYKVFLSRFDEFAKQHQQLRICDSREDALEWLHSEGFRGFENGLPNLQYVDGLNAK
ncbi:hypothetical protein [Lacimicrobium alkaliphilum]|uniref:STAS/SEC14 domain-containing protein n=1 Tax=Lacimicrobium alkaliphilum TaxID=1526571 RepID=A0A0U2RPN6_9ALTE|nr:hypothetical protein [Lacimicrobium alkaliphilum]ALS99322.1 hypothetical protein AT746_14350 [Lacimicrobium alkaliphilum]